MHPLTYLHFQLALEGLAPDADRLTRLAGSADADGLPLVLIAQLTTRERVAYYNEGLPAGLHGSLAECIHGLQFPHIDPVLDLLKTRDLRVEAGHFITYLFPAHPIITTDRIVMRFSKGDPRLRAIQFDGFAEPVFGIEQDGRVVSACVSVRENEHSGEAWVFTDPGHRNQGLAGQVVSAWAKSLTLSGKIPFYSHKAENAVSARLARRLGLQPIFEEITIRETV